MVQEALKTHCALEGCNDIAVVRPVITLVRPKPFPELEMTLNVPLCDEHRSRVKRSSLLTPRFWQRVSLQFRSADQPQPIREKTRIDWETL